MQETTAELLEKARLALDDGRWVLGEATRRLVPSQELDGWWDGYNSVAMAFAASENVCAQSMAEMRKSLEYVTAVDVVGETLIATSKMVLSAVVLFAGNPTGSLVWERDEMHDDLDPLLRKAVELLDSVAEVIEAGDAEYGTVRYVVEFDADYPQRLAKRNEQNRLRFLIDNAVRPSA